MSGVYPGDPRGLSGRRPGWAGSEKIDWGIFGVGYGRPPGGENGDTGRRF